MNKLLTTLAVLAAVGVQATGQTPLPSHRASAVQRQISASPSSRQFTSQRSLNPAVTADNDTYRLYESFENVTSNPIKAPAAYGLPDGWSSDGLLDLNDLGPNGALPTCWYTTSSTYSQTSVDGSFVAISPALKDDNKEVTLVSPAFTPLVGDELRLNIFYQPIRLFKGFIAWYDRQPNEWIDGEDGLILKRECNENIQVLISEDDGASWTVLLDAFNLYKDCGFWTMQDEHGVQTWHEYVFGLADYVGKSVKIAVRHGNYGDGGGICVDLVTVAAPRLSTSYYPSYPAYFWAYDSAMNGYYGRMAAPIHTPVTFESDDRDVNLTWTYDDPTEPGTTLTATGNSLAVTYVPDYEKYGPNGTYVWQSYPTLTATQEGASPGTYNYGQDFAFGQGGIAATGRAALYDPETGAMYDGYNFGMFNFDLARGISYLSFDAIGSPVFGYSGNTQALWTDHYFRGEPGNDDYAKCNALLNFFYPLPGRPMVVHGAKVYGIGKMKDADAANFRLEAFRLNEDYTMEDTPLRSATLSGTRVTVLDYEEFGFPYLVFEFNFDEPLIFEDFNMVLRFSGFDDPANIEYFAPLQSDLPDERQMCHAFGEVEVQMASYGQPARSTMIPVANFQNDLGDSYSSFLFSLDAEMPWLVSNETGFEAKVDETAHTFILDSWYDADKLSVTANTADGTLPDWITSAQLTGSKGNTRLAVETVPGNGEQCVLTVAGPGVSRSFAISQAEGSAIIGITGDRNTSGLRHYNLKGQPIAPDAPGVHVTSEGKFMRD